MDILVDVVGSDRLDEGVDIMLTPIDKLLRKCDQLRLEVESTDNRTEIISSRTYEAILDDMELLIKTVRA